MRSPDEFRIAPFEKGGAQLAAAGARLLDVGAGLGPVGVDLRRIGHSAYQRCFGLDESGFKALALGLRLREGGLEIFSIGKY